MNNSQILGLSSLLTLCLFGVCTTSARAEMFQEQSHHVTQSSSFSYSCEGNGCGGNSGEFKTSSEVKQTQSQNYGSFEESRVYARSRQNRRRNYWSNDGRVTLGWDHQGGTCHVRYTESGVSNYKYSTSAACDEGDVTIGGLNRGSNYRFQVKQDEGSWSAPMTMRAY